MISAVTRAGIDPGGRDLVEQPVVRNPAAPESAGRMLIDRPRPLSGPSHTAAQRSALRWTSRDSRSASPPAAARAKSSCGVRGNGRTCQRFGPDDTAGGGLDQRLEQDVDLFVRDRCFEQQVTPWGGGRRCPCVRRPPAPLTDVIQGQHTTPPRIHMLSLVDTRTEVAARRRGGRLTGSAASETGQ